MNFDYLANPAPGAMVLQFGRDNSRQTVAFVENLTQHDSIGSAVTQVQVSLATIAQSLLNAAPDLSDDGFTKEARRQIDAKLKPAYALTIEATYKAERETETEWQRLHTPRFPDDSEPAVRAEQRAWWRTLTMPAKLEAANADPALAAAIVEGGLAMSAMPADVFARLVRDMGEGQLADAIMRGQGFRTPQTPDDPIAGKPDRDAAVRSATARFDRLEAERELLGTVSPLLSSVINAVALMTGETRQAAFERLSA